MASSSIGYARVAWRMLLKQPGLALGRILTITVVITAVGAVLTVANAIFLRPLPFPNADRLVRLYLQPPGTSHFASATPHYPFTFMRFRERVQSFERFEGIWVADRAVTGDGEPDSISAGRVSAGFFAALGGETRAGRVFTEQEVADDVKVAVLSDGFWQRRFGGDLAVIGSTLVVDGESHTIIGVIRAGFDPAFTRTEFWTPLNLRAVERQGTTFVQGVGVLRPGVTAAQAESEMAALFPPIQDEWPAILKRNWRNGVLDLREARYGSQGNAVLMLLAAVIGLALLAVANLANLTLADVMFRRSDFAVRAALGASRAEIAAPEVVQAVIVAVIGAAAGLVGASLLVPALFALDPSNAFTADAITIDWRVAIAAVVSAAAIMIVAVAVPVLRFAGPKIASDLTSGSRRAIGGRSSARTRVALVVVQTAMALVLLSSSALIVRTLLQASEVDPGFEAPGVVTAQIRLNPRTYPTEGDRARFVEQMLERVRSTPGVIAAGTTLNVFLVGSPFFSLVQIEHQPQPDGQPYTMQFRRISPGYFDAMKTSILQGRDLTAQDRAGKPLVALVSRSLADRFWPGSQAVGKRLKRGAENAPWIEVVGVVEDVRDVGLDLAPADTVYTPVYQGSGAQAPVSLVVRTAGRSARIHPGDSPRRVGGRSQPAALEHPHARGISLQHDGGATVPRDVDLGVRADRPAARDDRHVWRHRAIGGRAHQGSRRQAGTRRRAAHRVVGRGVDEHSRHPRRRGSRRRIVGTGARRARGAAARAARRKSRVQLCGRRGAPRRRRVGGGARLSPRHVNRSTDRAQSRIIGITSAPRFSQNHVALSSFFIFNF